MTRTTTALAAAAAAAVLAAGPLAASTGTTSAAWSSADTIAGTAVTTGAFTFNTLSQSTWYTRTGDPTLRPFSGSTIQLDGGGSDFYKDAILRSELSAQVLGTGLGARLVMEYSWGANYDAVIGSWTSLVETATVNQTAVNTVSGNLPDNVKIDVLLWPTGQAAPSSWTGQVIYFDPSASSVVVDLRVYNNGFTGSWALGASGVWTNNPTGVSANNRVTATLTPYVNGGTVGWSASPRTATLPTLFNDSWYNAVRPSTPSLVTAPAPGPGPGNDVVATAPAAGDTARPVDTAKGKVPTNPAPAPVVPEMPGAPAVPETPAVKPDDNPTLDEAPKVDDPALPKEDEFDVYDAPDEDSA